jgi:hypothetical protein
LDFSWCRIWLTLRVMAWPGHKSDFSENHPSRSWKKKKFAYQLLTPTREKRKRKWSRPEEMGIDWSRIPWIAGWVSSLIVHVVFNLPNRCLDLAVAYAVEDELQLQPKEDKRSTWRGYMLKRKERFVLEALKKVDASLVFPSSSQFCLQVRIFFVRAPPETGRLN